MDALQYITITHPNIKFSINKVFQSIGASLKCNEKNSGGLVFKPSSTFLLQGFAYADWEFCLDDHRSTSSIVVFLGANPLI